MQSSMPAARPCAHPRGIPFIRRPRHLHPSSSSSRHPSSFLALYQRLIRCLRRLLSARRVVSYLDEFPPSAPRYRPQRINALCRITNFSRAEIKVFYQGFKQACPTGVVNESAFKDIFNSYFPQGDASLYAHHVFKTCDQQNNGAINFQEFLTGLSMLTRGATVDKLRWTFRLYDVDGDGRLDPREMREITTAVYRLLGRHTRPSVSADTADEHADKVFARLDPNRNGYVTFDEFLETCQKDENIVSSLQLLDTVL